MRVYDVEPAGGYPSDYGLLVSSLQVATAQWRRELGEVSEDAIVWQPYKNGHSIGAVILHMIDVEAFWIETAGLGRVRDAEELKELMADEIDQYTFQWVVPPRKPLTYYYELQDRIRARTLESIKSFPGPETQIMPEHWTASVTPRWILNHVAAHEAYHGGQLMILKTMFERIRLDSNA